MGFIVGRKLCLHAYNPIKCHRLLFTIFNTVVQHLFLLNSTAIFVLYGVNFGVSGVIPFMGLLHNKRNYICNNTINISLYLKINTNQDF